MTQSSYLQRCVYNFTNTVIYMYRRFDKKQCFSLIYEIPRVALFLSTRRLAIDSIFPRGEFHRTRPAGHSAGGAQEESAHFRIFPTL